MGLDVYEPESIVLRKGEQQFCRMNRSGNLTRLANDELSGKLFDDRAGQSEVKAWTVALSMIELSNRSEGYQELCSVIAERT